MKKVFVKKKNLPAKKKEAKKKIIGSVTHYFDNIKVAIIKFSQPIGVGEMIGFEEKKPFLQKITSIQLEHKNIQKAPKGKEVGIKVKKPVSVGCKLIMG
ncbi:MAG: hypothetical protein Q8P45_01730 [Candidatus Harrisonbacteria bacterium]|nr:hypothetical protein [Candidatus Harrisonbacteria bacterium]